jgi:DNA polymerase III epsilon subunit family exonuclease
MRLDDTSFTIFDFETTGLYPYSGDTICEIGAIRITPGKRGARRFHSLVDPGKPISHGAFAVNGITEEMLEGAPQISAVLPSFLGLMEDSVLVAYNAGFDLGFLDSALAGKRHILNDYYVIDALALARRLFSGLGRYNLGSVAESLGIGSDIEHRALADAVMTLGIFRKELRLLKKEGVNNVEDVAYPANKRTGSARKAKDHKERLIEEAIRDQEKLSIVYRSSWNDAVSERVILPRSMRRGYDRSYLVAHCCLKNEERTFRLDGIINIAKV